MSNVTPIRSGKPSRKRAQVKGLLLAESDEPEGFDTRAVLTGLNGVCRALDGLGYMRDMDLDLVEELARAAMVLSTILRNREAEV